jgi:hypothetical protein
MYVNTSPKTGNWKRIEFITATEETTAVQLIIGKVIEKENSTNKGFAFFKPDSLGENVYIPVHLVNMYSLRDEMPIQVEIGEYSNNRTGKQETRVRRIEIIQQ